MAFTTWDPKAKYRIQESCNCGCVTPDQCTCAHGHKEEHCCDEEANGGCGCPPAGLVAVKNGDGSFSGFLTPNDAQGFMNNIYSCPPGYIKDLDADGNFRSCILPSDYIILHP